MMNEDGSHLQFS